jgi:hypothetical protein
MGLDRTTTQSASRKRAQTIGDDTILLTQLHDCVFGRHIICCETVVVGRERRGVARQISGSCRVGSGSRVDGGGRCGQMLDRRELAQWHCKE